MELPTLPSMYPHDSEGDSMLSELSRSVRPLLVLSLGSHPPRNLQADSAPAV